MTPDEKEQLVLALKDSGRTCMMCGDGANDVGALKQAQVRLTLIWSPVANVNWCVRRLFLSLSVQYLVCFVGWAFGGRAHLWVAAYVACVAASFVKL